MYAGTDTRDAYHTGWNGSTELVHPRDSQRFIDATRQPMIDKTKATNEKILNGKTQTSGQFYTTPEQLSAAISAKTRDMKVQEAEMRKQLTQQVRNEKPAASEDTVNATVTRLICEREGLESSPRLAG